MASATIHLAITKKIIEKNHLKNGEEMIAGTLYPDACDNKDATHYTKKNRGSDNLSHIRGKVDLYSFLQDHPNLNEFDFGWFIHLVTDYLFFEECFSEKYLLETTYEKFCQDLYFAYNCLNSYLSKKYHITKDDYKQYPKEFYEGESYQKCLFTKEQIDEFIERVSKINFKDYIKKINTKKNNVKP